jgi:hypothetical protein
MGIIRFGTHSSDVLPWPLAGADRGRKPQDPVMAGREHSQLTLHCVITAEPDLIPHRLPLGLSDLIPYGLSLGLSDLIPYGLSLGLSDLVPDRSSQRCAHGNAHALPLH